MSSSRTYSCKQCGTSVSASVPPATCPACHAPAQAAFASGNHAVPPPIPTEIPTKPPLIETVQTDPFAEALHRVIPDRDPLAILENVERKDHSIEVEIKDIQETIDDPSNPGLAPHGATQRRGRIAHPTDYHPSDETLHYDDLVSGLPHTSVEPVFFDAETIKRPRALPSQNERLEASFKEFKHRRVALWLWILIGLSLSFALFRTITVKNETPPSTPFELANALQPTNAQHETARDATSEPVRSDSIRTSDANLSDPQDGSSTLARHTVRSTERQTRKEPSSVAKMAIEDAGTTDSSRTDTEKTLVPTVTPQNEEAQAHYQKGLQLLLLGKSSEAATHFETLVARFRRFGLGYRGLGLAYEKLAQRAEAIQAFETYLSMEPNANDAALIRQRIATLKGTP